VVSKLLALIFFCMLGLQFAQAEEAHLDETNPEQEVVEESVKGTSAKCQRCHDFGADHILGPSLAGVYGRKAGSIDYMRYSDSLKNADFVWNEENLRTFLRDTKQAIKLLTGNEHALTRMPPLHLSEAEIDEAIAFLKALR